MKLAGEIASGCAGVVVAVGPNRRLMRFGLGWLPSAAIALLAVPAACGGSDDSQSSGFGSGAGGSSSTAQGGAGGEGGNDINPATTSGSGAGNGTGGEGAACAATVLQAESIGKPANIIIAVDQ